MDTADETADGPGNGIMFISFLMHSLTNNVPGSEMLGVPASDTREIIRPCFNNPTILGKFFFFIKFMIRD